ncbi:MAG TPA: alpha/beta hydrolase [Jatrophihabitantaceae bacterium]|nr:alpha/beta hydrolase [Jatrophihabitantaceae bacterium]
METMVRVGVDVLWADDTGGPGEPVVLLHPGIADSTIWDGMLPALAAQYRVIRYDVRGYGRSPEATTEYVLLDDLLAVLDHFELPHVALVGCSMGGGTSVDLALADPGRVAAMVLVCPGISGYPWPDEPELDAEFDALAQAGDLDGLAEVGLRIWVGAGADEAARALMRAAVRAWLNEEEFQRAGLPAFDRLGEIHAPTVIMVGDLDRPALISCNEEAVGRMPDARLVRVPGGDHLLALRHPGLVTDTVLGHLAAITSRW